MSKREVCRVRFLGIEVDALAIPDLNTLIDQAIKTNKTCIIAHHNMHSLYLHRKDEAMRRFYSMAKFVHIDGMALVFVGRLFGFHLERRHRVTYVDWTPVLVAKAAEQGWRIFYLGSKPEVAKQGAAILRQRFPELEIGTSHGYFNSKPDGAENTEIVQKINDFQPHILMVGMGMPRQEHWIMNNRDRLQVNVILPSGAAIDYVAGAVPTPPRWAGKIGLEWLFRLFSEPRRLWRRYLIEPVFICCSILIEYIRRS